MLIYIFLAIGIITGWIAGEVAKEYGFGVPTEIIFGLLAALSGGILVDYYGLNPFGLPGSVSFAFLASVTVLFLTKIRHAAHHA